MNLYRHRVGETVNGRDVRGLAALRTALGALDPGAPVVAQVERGGELRYLAFRLA